MPETIVMADFIGRCEFGRDGYRKSRHGGVKHYCCSQFRGSNGDPDIGGVIYSALQLIHSSACLWHGLLATAPRLA
jgi:hypothetical protein